jgi:hypothetical protein
LRPTNRESDSPVIAPVMLFLVTLEGFLAVWSMFNGPASLSDTTMLGSLLPRILAGLVLVSLVLPCGYAAARSLLAPGWLREKLRLLDDIVATKRAATTYVVLGLIYISVVGGFTLLLFRYSLVPETPHAIRVAVGRLYGGLLWLTSIPIQLLLLMALRYHRNLKVAFSAGSPGWKGFLALLVVLGASIQWITLATRAEWVTRIWGRSWGYDFGGLRPSHVHLLVVVAIGVVGAGWLLRIPRGKAYGVLLCVLLAFVLQVEYGYAKGQGFDSLRKSYLRYGQSAELQLTCEYKGGLVESIANYEAEHSQSYWLSSKPPGLLAFYLMFRALVGLFNPEILASSGYCLSLLATIGSYTMPAVASLTVLPIYWVVRLLRPDLGGYSVALLYSTVPSVLRTPLLPDQFLFPLVFMLTVVVVTKVVAARRFSHAAMVGCAMYVCVFVSFSLLSIIGIALVWLLIDHLAGERRRTTHDLLLPALGIILGFGVTAVLVWVMVGYNPVVRLGGALAAQRQIMQEPSNLGELLNRWMLNGIEFAFSFGFPAAVLLLVSIATCTTSLVRGRGTMAETLSVAFLFTVLGTGVAWQMRAEVGRLWLFLMPIGCVALVGGVSKLVESEEQAILAVSVLEVITACLMFIYMGY